MEEEVLFEQYEIRGLELGPRLYKIIGVSVLLNLLFLVVAAQGNLLTRKGCESPMVSKFCSVLDAVYVGSLLISADANYVDRDYEKIELADADITWVDVSNLTPLKYPEGYFALANPELLTEQGGLVPNDLSTIPVTQGSTEIDPAKIPANLPTPNPNGVVNLPNNPFGDSQKIPPVVNKTPPVNKPSTEKPAEVADTKPEIKPEDLYRDEQYGVDVNKRPLRDFASAVKIKVDEQKVDVTKPVTLKGVAVLKKDGTFDVTIDKKTKLPKSRIISSDGDKPMQEIAKQAIEAVGSSGFFMYLTTLDVDTIEYTLVQDDQQIRVMIVSSQATPERASVIAKGLEAMISGALALNTGGRVLGPDETVLLQGAKTESSGKQFVLNFTIPKPVAQEMITRRLREVTPQPTPSSTTQTKDGKTNGE